MATDRAERPYHGTQLFTVRLWIADLGTPPDPQVEWYSKVQHVTSGEVRYFHDWPTLIDLLQILTAADEATEHR